MHILIIEDEPVIAQTIADLLATQGGTAELAYDGVTGLNLALTKQYDAVVLDIMLPGLDGFQVAQTLRQRGISTPILMLTARTQVGDRVQALFLPGAAGLSPGHYPAAGAGGGDSFILR